MSILKTIGRLLFNRVPAYNLTIYRFCQRYLDRFNGDNNSDPTTNGEEFFLREGLPILKGGTVFDVGANLGNWAKMALKIDPSLQLHCFEPSNDTFRQLCMNQWSSNVYLNNLGLGEAAGQLEMNIVGSFSGLNSLYARRGVDSWQAMSKETISIITCDDYCEEKGVDLIHFFKVDVEGHELAVFKGMRHMLSERRVQMIQFEYGGCNLDARVYLADIWDYLAQFGFKFYKLYPEGPRAIPIYSQELETFKYANYLARIT